MKINKTMWIIPGVLLIVAIALMAIIPFVRTTVWWIAAACTVVMFGVCAYSISLAFKTGGNTESKLLGWPVFRTGFMLLIIQLIAGFALMGTAKFCPWQAAVIVEIVIFAFAAIGLTVKTVARDVVTHSEAKVEDRTGAWKAIRAKVNNLAAADAEWKKIAEDIRYADPTPRMNDTRIAAALEAEDKRMVRDLLNERKNDAKV